MICALDNAWIVMILVQPIKGALVNDNVQPSLCGVSPQIVPGLPKTRSGKIMRRILRKIAADRHDELGDVSTLADPSVVEKIVQEHNLLKNDN